MNPQDISILSPPTQYIEVSTAWKEWAENVSNPSSCPPPTLCSGTTLIEKDLTSTRSDLQAHYHPFRFLTEFPRQLVLMGSATPNAPCVKFLSGRITLILVLTKKEEKQDDQTHNSQMTHCEKLWSFIIDFTPYLRPVLHVSTT